jgi:hypothetical protein
MAAQFDDGPHTPASGEGVIHNSVLIRTHEPSRMTHRWVVPAVLGLAILAGGSIWGVMATHPSGPLVNQSVASAPTSPGWAK